MGNTEQGLTGPQGDTGPMGPQGPVGPQGPPGPSPEPPERTAALIVKKIVDRQGQPNPAQPADFLMHINGDNAAPSEFPGSESGVTVFLAPGPYSVYETNPGVSRLSCLIFSRLYWYH